MDDAAGKTRHTLLARPGQTLREHLGKVARRAGEFGAKFNAAAWARPCGLLHDIGKASALFQARVREDTKRQVDHSTAGAREAASRMGQVGRILAYCIAGHHSGLADGQANEEGSLEHRLDPGRKALEDFSAWKECLGPEAELAAPAAMPLGQPAKGREGFRLAFFIRMLFSCLVDADRLDAESVGDKGRAAQRAYPGLDELSRRLDAHLAGFAADTPVRKIRAEVLTACRKASALPPGLFSLTVPTGGGKTLSSLAFALDHARKHGLDRVISVIPYTSIIEQNARVFREALGDPEGEFVIEHHSNLNPPGKDIKADDPGREDARPHPATENWDAPLIVTTAVQFFESLYSHKAGRCRKLHNLARSVIILDEAQMMPLPYLRPCLEAIRELAEAYGASVVLCTATQPALMASDDPNMGLKGGLENVREIMPDPVRLHERLRRVQVDHVGVLAEAELARRLAEEPQVLCIVNTRREARRLFEALRARSEAAGGGLAEAETAGGGPPANGLFHLSALMCPEHRTRVIGEIREALAQGRACRVVGTTILECGVDLDFPVVFRAEGGIDSIAQAAGRCNREGRLEQDGQPRNGRVFVFRPEAGLPPGHFRATAQAARSVADRHAADLLHPEAVRDYFLEFYWQAGEERLDAKSVLTRLAWNTHLWFPFRTIGREFQFIESATQGLIIPLAPQAKEVVAALRVLESGDRAGGLLRRAQRHTISLYEREMDRLVQAGAVERIGPAGQFFVLSNMDLYDEAVGLDLYRDDPGVREPEGLFI
jgi:CRISPR-associated endonuclease/helicase Cas3